MNFNHYLGSDVGQKRKANEDFHGDRMTVNGYVFVVCDGMGGHVGGATASQLAVQSILEFFDKEPLDNIILGIDKAIKFANEQIFATALAQPELKGMGTTATITIMREEGAYIGHVGDSRIYLKSDGKLNRLTKDHSFVQGLVDQGIIKDDEAESHPQKNQILKALGIREDVDATVCESPIQLKVGDTILMCSDGLSGLVTDSRMEELVNENNVQQSAVDLINEANQNGGDDNITAAVISVTESQYTETVFKHFNPTSVNTMATVGISLDINNSPKWYQNTKLIIILGGALFVIIAGLLTFILWPDDKPLNEENIVNQNTKLVEITDDTTIINIEPDELGKLKENQTILILVKDDTLQDGKYHCKGYDVEIIKGKIDKISTDINSGEPTPITPKPRPTTPSATVSTTPSSPASTQPSSPASTQPSAPVSTQPSAPASTIDTDEEADVVTTGTDENDGFLNSEKVPQGQGWDGFLNALKCNCTKEDIIGWNKELQNDPELKLGKSYLYKILK